MEEQTGNSSAANSYINNEINRQEQQIARSWLNLAAPVIKSAWSESDEQSTKGKQSYLNLSEAVKANVSEAISTAARLGEELNQFIEERGINDPRFLVSAIDSQIKSLLAPEIEGHDKQL